MAERQYHRLVTVDSSPVQGEGSFVRFKRLTWGELEPLLSAKNLDIALAMIDGWNWVDDDGNPIPVESAQGVLIQQEIDWLVQQAVALRETERKN